MSIEAMKQAIEALNEAVAFREGGRQKAIDAINALRTAIQQAESEPVYQIRGDIFDCPHAWRDATEEAFYVTPVSDRRILYTHPAPGVPDDVVRDARRWRVSELISEAALKHPDSRTEAENTAFNAYRAAISSGNNYASCIDAAMLAASSAQKGGE